MSDGPSQAIGKEDKTILPALIDSFRLPSNALNGVDAMLCYTQVAHWKTSLRALCDQYDLSDKELFRLCEWFILNETLQKYNAVPPTPMHTLLDSINSEENQDLLYLYRLTGLLKELCEFEPFAIRPCLVDEAVLKSTLEYHLRSRNETQNDIAIQIVNLQETNRDHFYRYYYTSILNSMFSSLLIIIDPLLTTKLMFSRFEKYSIIRTLEQDSAAYSAFVYSLLDSLKTTSTESFRLLFQEIIRMEPSADESIQFIFKFITLMNCLNLNYDLRSFFQFASGSPFTATFIQDSWFDYLRERVNKKDLAVFKKICELVSLPGSHVSKAFVWSQLVYPYKDSFDWIEPVEACLDEFTHLEIPDLLEVMEYCFFNEECSDFYNILWLSARQKLTNQAVGILKSVDKLQTTGQDALQLFHTMQSYQLVTEMTSCNFFELHCKQELNTLITDAYREGIEWSIVETAIDVVSKAMNTNKQDVLITFCIQNLAHGGYEDVSFLSLFASFLQSWEQQDLTSLFIRIETLLDETPFSPQKCMLTQILCYFCSSFAIPRLRAKFAQTGLRHFFPQVAAVLPEQASLTEIVETVIATMKNEWPMDRIADLLIECMMIDFPANYVISLTTADVMQLASADQALLTNLYHRHFYDSVAFNNVSISREFHL